MPGILSKTQCMIGVDIGTSSTKVIAYSNRGKILTLARRSYALLQPHPGYAEQDPETLYSAVTECISEVCKQLEGQAVIAGFSFSSAMHSFLALDKDNNPLTNIITWADTRSSGEAEKLGKHPDAKILYENTGVPMHPMTPLTKICWFQNNLPQLAGKTTMYSGIKEYILFRLTGVHVTDHSIASATGMFNIHTLEWYKPALEMAGISEKKLPQIVSTTHALYSLDPALQNRWNLPQNIPFFTGASDGCLANLGTGAVETGDLAVTIGTSGAVRMAAASALPDKLGRTFNYVLTPSMYIAGGPVNNGGIILKWFTENFLNKSFSGESDFTSFLEEAAKAPAGSAGLICLPYFMGERAPVWNARLTGIFYGIQLQHGREHMMRAIVEGISFSLRHIAEILTESQGPYARIFASGGFVHSPVWMQWLADIFNRPVYISQTEDASAIGAAMLGWLALGNISHLSQAKQWIEILQTYQPDTAAHELYRDSFKKYLFLSNREAENISTLQINV